MLREQNLIFFCINTYHKIKIRVFEISENFTLLKFRILKYLNLTISFSETNVIF